MKKRLFMLTLLGACLLSCSEGKVTVNVDILSFLDTTVINYQSRTFNLDQSLPLDTQLPAGTNPVLTEQITPIRVNLLEGGSDLADIKSTSLTMKMSISPQGFSGPVTMVVYIARYSTVYAHGMQKVTMQDKQIVPATFEFNTSNALLNEIFENDELYIGMEFILEPTSLTSHQVSVSGHVEEFRAVLQGEQGIF